MVRIRKNASRLLGSDYLLYPPPPPPAESWGPHSSSTTAAAAAAKEEDEEEEEEEVILCRLNCSPWDIIGTDLDHLSWSCFQEEGGDEGRGIMGNGLKFEEYEEILSTFEAITRYCSTDEIELKKSKDDDDDDDHKKVKKRRKRKKKEEEENAIEDVVAKSVVVICSKNDGKGWHCKRPANPRHTLCDHHLDLLRNYSSRTNGNGHRESYDESETERSKSTAGDGVSVKSTHRAKAVGSDTGGDGFYYYSGFGPWRGKKRSSGGMTSNSRGKEEVEERKDDSDDDDDGPVAGDDLDDDDDEDDDEDDKGRIVKKKGRKRVKARSLKSLM